jgi:hypothetical protein
VAAAWKRFKSQRRVAAQICERTLEYGSSPSASPFNEKALPNFGQLKQSNKCGLLRSSFALRTVLHIPVRDVGGGHGSDPEARHHGEVAGRYPQQSPYVSIANRQAEIMMRIASEFGFTQASRGRISTPPADKRTLFDIVDDGSGRVDKRSAVAATIDADQFAL